jgi:adenosylmethionine-8-amino-7-oxononanoate aminotransferase
MIKTLKGDGLIRGAEIVNRKGMYDEEMAKVIQNELVCNGVLVRHSKYTLIFKPPIVITEDEMAKGFEKIKGVMKKYV